MATTGKRYPAAVSSVAGTWTALSAALLNSDNRSGTTGAAYNPCTRNTNFEYQAQNFGLDALIPVGATIDSVIIEYQQAYSASTTSTTTLTPNVGATALTAQTQTATPTADTTYTYDITSLHTPWTRDDLLDGTFTVNHRVRRTATGTLNYFVDYICVTVVYTPHFGPNAPVSAAATDIAETAFTANWAASVVDATHDAATKYYLDVATDQAFSMFVPGYTSLDVGNVTTYRVSSADIAGNTTYWYRVRGWNPVDYSGNSGAQSLTTLAGGVFTPVRGSWRWYTDAAPDTSMSALAAQDATPTLTGAQMQNAVLRLRLQVKNTGGAPGTTGALELQYSQDGTNWQNIRVQVDSSLQGVWFRHANGACTDGATLGSLLLTGSTEAGAYHESGTATQAVSASAVTEIDFPVLVHWPPPDVTVRFRLLDGGTPLTLDAGATEIQLTMCAAADRPYTISYLEPQPSVYNETEALHGGMNRRLWYDGEKWWLFYSEYSTSNTICARYWTGTGGWSAKQTVTNGTSSTRGWRNTHTMKVIGGNPVGLSVWGPSSTTIRARRFAISGTTISWGAESDAGTSGSQYHATGIADDDHYWIVAATASTITAKRSTNADTGSGWTAGWEADKTLADAEISTYSALSVIPIGGADVLVFYSDYGSTYHIKAARCTASSGFSAAVDVTTLGSSATASRWEDWSAVRGGPGNDYVYCIHTSSSSPMAGSWLFAIYKISTNTWTRGPAPHISMTTGGSDMAPLSWDAANGTLYFFRTGNGPEGAEDRVIEYETFTPSGDTGTWNNDVTLLSPGSRDNMDEITATQGADGGKVIVAALTCDDGMIGTGFALEYHVIEVVTGPRTLPWTVTLTVSSAITRPRRAHTARSLAVSGALPGPRRVRLSTRLLSAGAVPSMGTRLHLAEYVSVAVTGVVSGGRRVRKGLAALCTGALGRTRRAHHALSLVVGATLVRKRLAHVRTALTSTASITRTAGYKYVRVYAVTASAVPSLRRGIQAARRVTASALALRGAVVAHNVRSVVTGVVAHRGTLHRLVALQVAAVGALRKVSRRGGAVVVSGVADLGTAVLQGVRRFTKNIAVTVSATPARALGVGVDRVLSVGAALSIPRTLHRLLSRGVGATIGSQRKGRVRRALSAMSTPVRGAARVHRTVSRPVSATPTPRKALHTRRALVASASAVVGHQVGARHVILAVAVNAAVATGKRLHIGRKWSVQVIAARRTQLHRSLQVVAAGGASGVRHAVYRVAVGVSAAGVLGRTVSAKREAVVGVLNGIGRHLRVGLAFEVWSESLVRLSRRVREVVASKVFFRVGRVLREFRVPRQGRELRVPKNDRQEKSK